MKITKQELRKIIMEELENEVKSLNEFEFHPGMSFEEEEAMRRSNDEADRLRNAEIAKEKEDDRNARAMYKKGQDTSRSKKLLDPRLKNNKDYIKGYLDHRERELEHELSGMEFRSSKIIGLAKMKKSSKELYQKIASHGSEIKAIKDGSWMEKYGK